LAFAVPFHPSPFSPPPGTGVTKGPAELRDSQWPETRENKSFPPYSLPDFEASENLVNPQGLKNGGAAF
jgi:hypothetical protein